LLNKSYNYNSYSCVPRKAVGIIFCRTKNKTLAKMAFPENKDDERITTANIVYKHWRATVESYTLQHRKNQ